jgi:AcrR family transcriptional regulator
MVGKKVAKSAEGDERPLRGRILAAAFAAFVERGYANTSTLEIATRAKVSKRELYAEFESKREMLTACIASGAKRMQAPLNLPAPRDREMLMATLVAFGRTVLREVSRPEVVAVFRLAIAEAGQSAEVAEILHAAARDPSRAALAELVSKAQSAGLIGVGDCKQMAARFIALLWEDLLMRLLFGMAKPPNDDEIAARAEGAATALLRLYPAGA